MPDRLTKCLVEQGYLTQDGADEAIERQVLMGGALDTALLELNVVDEDAILHALGVAYNSDTATPRDVVLPPDGRALRVIPEKWARKHRIAPLRLDRDDSDVLIVLSPAPLDYGLVKRWGELLEIEIRALLVPEFRVEQRLALLYNFTPDERLQPLIAAHGGHAAAPQLVDDEDLDFAAAVARLRDPKSRDHIARTTLRHVGRDLEFVALFIVQEGLLEGWMARGAGAENVPGTSVAVDPDSAFRVVLDTRAHYLGPLAQEEAHKDFLRRIGRSHPRSVLIVPMRIRDRTVSLLYAENGRNEIPARIAADAMLFVSHVQAAMLTLLLRRKAPSFSQLPVSEPDEIVSELPIPAPVAEASHLPFEPHRKGTFGHTQSYLILDSLEPPAEDEEPTEGALPTPAFDADPEDRPSDREQAAITTRPAEPEYAEHETLPTPPLVSDAVEEINAEASFDRSLASTSSAEELDSLDLPSVAEEASIDLLGAEVEGGSDGLEDVNEGESIDLSGSLIAGGESGRISIAREPHIGKSPEKAVPTLRNDSEDLDWMDTTLPTAQSKISQALDELSENPTVDEDTLRSEDTEVPVSSKELDEQLLETHPNEPSSEPTRSPGDTWDSGEAVKKEVTDDAPTLSSLDRERFWGEGQDDWGPVATDSWDEGSIVPPPAPVKAAPGQPPDSLHSVPDLDESTWWEGPSDTIRPLPLPPEVVQRAAQRPSSTGGAKLIPVHPARSVPLEPGSRPFEAEVRSRLDQLEHAMKRVRTIAREALATMGEPALPIIVERFPGPLTVNPFAPEVVLPPFPECGPLLALIAQHGRKAHVFVERRLDAPDPIIRFFATYFYSAVYVPEAVSRLIQRLHDEEARICMTAARTLFGYRSHSVFKQVLEHLHGRLSASSIAARRHAAFLIGLFRDVTAVPELISIIERKERSLMDVAEGALAEITKQRFGSNVRRWRSWWAKNENRNRIEWLIEGLASRDAAIRKSACEELRAVTSQNFEYDPAAPKRRREEARKRWLNWWANQSLTGT